MTSFPDVVERLDISPDYHFKSIVEARAFDVLIKLERLVEDGLLKEQNLKGRVLDIGAGQGGSYEALRQYSDDVTAIEPNRHIADLLVENSSASK